MPGASGRNTRIAMAGYNMSNVLRSINSGLNSEVLETTVFSSSGEKEFIPGGLKGATVSAEGLHSSTLASVVELNRALASSTHQVWSVYPEGWTAGNYGYGLHTIETNYEITSPLDGVVSIAVEGNSKVGRDELKSLRALASATTSGASASQDNSAASTRSGVGYYHRTDTGSKGSAVLVQHSSAASTWATIATFSTATGIRGQRVASTASTIKRYLRTSFTLSTGGTGSPTFQVGFSRK